MARGGQHLSEGPDHGGVAPCLVGGGVAAARGGAGCDEQLVVHRTPPLQQLPVEGAGDGVEGACSGQAQVKKKAGEPPGVQVR